MSNFGYILSKIASDTTYNLHSHTEFCDGRATMEAFARQAVRDNFKIYGFSPHSPIPFNSPCNMSASNVDIYIKECDRIRIEHPETEFFKGMEIDYLDKTWGPSSDYFQSIPLDYRIGSVHFIRSQKGDWIDIDGSNSSFATKLRQDFNGDLNFIIETFFQQSVDMVDLGGFDIIGHLDKIADNAEYISPGIENTPKFENMVLDLIKHIADAGISIEINTKKYTDKQRFFPNRKYWKEIRNLKIPIIINSDAHIPALINSGRNIAIQALKNI